LLMLGRQVLSFLLRFPKAIVEFAVSAITTLGRALVDTVRSVLTPNNRVAASLTDAGVDGAAPMDDALDPVREKREFAMSARESARGSLEVRRVGESTSGSPAAADAQPAQPEAAVSAVEPGPDLRRLLKERREDLREQIRERRQTARDDVRSTSGAPGREAGVAESTPQTEPSDSAPDQGGSPGTSTSDAGPTADPE
jgi:hypothetical protein